MKKRGSSQIDWIISLSLFLLYVGWFFVFIRPSINLGTSKDALVTIITNNFEDDSSWQLKKYPLFVEYNLSGGRKPLMLDYNLNATDIYFVDYIPFTIWNNKLLFVANVTTGMNTFWLIEGTNQTSQYGLEGLNIEPDRAVTENLTVYLDDYLPDTLFYKGTELIESMSYKINDYSFVSDITNYTDNGFAAFFSAGNPNFNHTAIVFSYSPEINNFIQLEQNTSYIMQITADIYDFDSYFSDNNHYGNFEYENDSQSMNYSFDYITIYSSNKYISMFFDNYVSFNFTSYNSTLTLNIFMPISDNYHYRFVFHDGNYSEVKRASYSSQFGAVDYLTGININNITTNYSYLKEIWGFPDDSNFQILVYDNSTAFHYLSPEPLYEIGTFTGQGKNVYSESEDKLALDENGNYQTISLLYRIW